MRGLGQPLRRALAGRANALERQLVVLNWFFEQFEKHLPPERIVRYEEVVATRGAALLRTFGSPLVGDLLASRNANVLYGADVEHLAAALRRWDGAWRRFYTPKDCEDTALALAANHKACHRDG